MCVYMRWDRELEGQGIGGGGQDGGGAELTRRNSQSSRSCYGANKAAFVCLVSSDQRSNREPATPKRHRQPPGPDRADHVAGSERVDLAMVGTGPSRQNSVKSNAIMRRPLMNL